MSRPPAPLQLDLAQHGIPGLVDAEAETIVDAAAAPPPREARQTSPAGAALSRALHLRRAPVMLSQDGRMVRCALLPASAAPESRGPYLTLTLAGRPAAIRIGWNIARRITGVPLEPSSPEDAALLLEDALTPWLDEAEDLLGVEIRFQSLDRSRPQGVDTTVALGFEAPSGKGADAPGFRHVLPLMLHDRAAGHLAQALAPWLRPREAPAGLWLRAAVEVETVSLSLADLASLGVGDALLIEDRPDATARVVIEDRLVADATASGQETGREAWTLLEALRPRRTEAGPQAGGDRQTEEWMAQGDDPKPRPKPSPEAAAADGPVIDLTSFEGSLRDTAGPAARAASAPPAASAPDAASERPEARPSEPEAAPQGGPAPRRPAGQPDARPSDPRQPPSSLDALEMRLSIRLGETLISISDLRSAGPGTVLVLDRPDGALVDIVANGQPIGTGEIITVSGQRAVEIRTLFGDG